MENTSPEALLPAPDTLLTLSALLTLIHALGISRLVRPEITEKGLPAVRLCGLLRLRRATHPAYPQMVAERRNLVSGRWQRLTPAAERKLLARVPVTGFGNSDNGIPLLHHVRQLAYTLLLDALAHRRIIVTGHVSTVLTFCDHVRVRGQEWSLHTTPERRMNYAEAELWLQEVSLYGRRRLPFSLPLAASRHITLPGVRDTLSLLSLLRHYPGLNLLQKHKTAAPALLRKWLWQDAGIRESLRALRVVMTDCQGGRPPFMAMADLTLAVHRRFSQRFRFNGAPPASTWAPLLLLARSPRQVFCDGSNASLLAAIGHLPGISRGALKRLRRLPPDTLKAYISARQCLAETADEYSQTDSRLPEAVFTLLTELATWPGLRPLPRSIVRRLLLDHTWKVIARCRQPENTLQGMADCHIVIRHWCHWHRTLKKTVGGTRRAKARWDHEYRQLEHVIDWCLFTSPPLPKNRHWGALWLAAQRWQDELNGGAECNPAARWPALLPANGIPDGAEEITTAMRLCREGREMSHCVASYQLWCESGRYAVFALQVAGERATLGLMKQQEQWQTEQVRGPDNEPVSPVMAALAKRVEQAVRHFQRCSAFTHTIDVVS
ncbi:TPA: hypothetical protein OME38_004596 [Klebsiella oxytoca]|nr:hypothetical protein [Klebsiella oxytoca]